MADDDLANLFCGCFGENILDAIDITEGPIEAFTKATSAEKNTTTTTATDDISTTSHTACNNNNTNGSSSSINFTTQHPPAEVISIYPTYSVNPAPTTTTEAIKAKQRVPPGQEDKSSSMMRSLENSFLAVQVDLLYGLSTPPGILEDRIAKRKRQREKHRKLEEARMKQKLEKESTLKSAADAAATSTASDAATAAAATETPFIVSKSINQEHPFDGEIVDPINPCDPPICEAPTMDSSEDASEDEIADRDGVSC
jgi:hypothetical protein